MPPPDSAACQEGTVRPAVPVALLSHRGRWYHSCGPGTRDGAREPGRTGRVPARSSVGSGREGPPRQSDRLTPCDGGSRRGTWLSGRHKSEVPGTPGPAVPVRSAPGVATPRPLASPTFHTPGPAEPPGALRHSPTSKVLQCPSGRDPSLALSPPGCPPSRVKGPGPPPTPNLQGGGGAGRGSPGRLLGPAFASRFREQPAAGEGGRDRV